MEDFKNLIISAQLSALRALLGEITLNMRAVALKVEEGSIHLQSKLGTPTLIQNFRYVRHAPLKLLEIPIPEDARF